MKTYVTTLIVAACLTITTTIHARTIEYHITIDHKTVNFTGRDIKGIAVNNQIPAPTLTFTEGDTARIHVHNNMDVPTSTHWHGLLLPNDQDGISYLTTPPIKPHSTHTFEFPLIQAGTYWYHSHTGLQEQRGVYGALVIHPKQPNPAHTADHDYTLVLSDWTNEDPHEVLRTLKRGSEYYSFKKGSTQSLLGAIQQNALPLMIEQGMMRMPSMDISDIAYDAFLSNGQPQTTLEAKSGETVRLRIINAAASTYFYLNAATGPLRVIAADGLDTQPADIDRLLITVAETYDLLMTLPDENAAIELRATAQDGTAHTSTFIGPPDAPKRFAPDIPKPNPYTTHANHDMHHMDAMDAMDDQHHSHHQKPRPDAPYHLLRAPTPTTLPSDRPWRTINLDVTGDMSRYVWSFNNKTLSEEDKILIRHGENVRIVFDNKTMMHHPIHLHGHFFRVLNEHGEYSPLKHTVDVPPMGKRTIEFAATEDKDWFLHCHILYHMKSGMARIVHYEGSTVDPELAAARNDPANPIGKDHTFTWASASLLSHMSLGQFTIANTRNTLTTTWEAAYDTDEEDQYEFTLTADRHLDRFTSIFAGVTSSEEQSTRAIAGLRYLLPMNIHASAWIDNDAETRISAEYELQLTDHMTATAEAHYDTDTRFESTVRLDYLLDKNQYLTIQHHSEFGPGVGLTFEF